MCVKTYRSLPLLLFVETSTNNHGIVCVSLSCLFCIYGHSAVCFRAELPDPVFLSSILVVVRVDAQHLFQPVSKHTHLAHTKTADHPFLLRTRV